MDEARDSEASGRDEIAGLWFHPALAV